MLGHEPISPAHIQSPPHILGCWLGWFPIFSQPLAASRPRRRRPTTSDMRVRFGGVVWAQVRLNLLED
uniref:Uncharacterized protein n=1 Tax=Oryza nivara TaxID=4536 RepID=A0A0E0IIL3_ORYNI